MDTGPGTHTGKMMWGHKGGRRWPRSWIYKPIPRTASNCQKLGESKRDYLPEPLDRTWSWQPWFRTPSLQDCETIHFHPFKPSSVWHFIMAAAGSQCMPPLLCSLLSTSVTSNHPQVLLFLSVLVHPVSLFWNSPFSLPQLFKTQETAHPLWEAWCKYHEESSFPSTVFVFSMLPNCPTVFVTL